MDIRNIMMGLWVSQLCKYFIEKIPIVSNKVLCKFQIISYVHFQYMYIRESFWIRITQLIMNSECHEYINHIIRIFSSMITI